MAEAARETVKQSKEVWNESEGLVGRYRREEADGEDEGSVLG